MATTIRLIMPLLYVLLLTGVVLILLASAAPRWTSEELAAPRLTGWPRPMQQDAPCPCAISESRSVGNRPLTCCSRRFHPAALAVSDQKWDRELGNATRDRTCWKPAPRCAARNWIAPTNRRLPALSHDSRTYGRLDIDDAAPAKMRGGSARLSVLDLPCLCKGDRLAALSSARMSILARSCTRSCPWHTRRAVRSPSIGRRQGVACTLKTGEVNHDRNAHQCNSHCSRITR